MVRPLIAILQKSDDHLLAVGAAVLFLTCAAAELFPQRTTSTVVGAQPSWSHALATRCALALLLRRLSSTPTAGATTTTTHSTT
jgi:hypothetical protein